MSGILQELIGTSQAVAAPATPAILTIDGLGYIYSAGKTFDLPAGTAVSTTLNITTSANVTVKVELWGGAGGSLSTINSFNYGGGGAYVSGNYQFKTGITYGLVIAMSGQTAVFGNPAAALGGVGAYTGGTGYFPSPSGGTIGGGGGGCTGLFSSLTISLANVIAIAAGGGGGGSNNNVGGNGGGAPTYNGSAGVGGTTAAGGGTTSAAGAGGTTGGSAGGGANPGRGGAAGGSGSSAQGGGGGAGYYGGGGGGYSPTPSGGSGGGGSSAAVAPVGALTAPIGGSPGLTAFSNAGVLARPYGGFAGQRSGATTAAPVTTLQYFPGGTTWLNAFQEPLGNAQTSTDTANYSVRLNSAVSNGATSITVYVRFTTSATRAAGAVNMSLNSVGSCTWFRIGDTFTIDGMSGTYTVSANGTAASTTISFSPGLASALAIGAVVRLTPNTASFNTTANTGMPVNGILRINGGAGQLTAATSATVTAGVISIGAVYPANTIPIDSVVDRLVTQTNTAVPQVSVTAASMGSGWPGAARFTFVSQP